jgi:hypothetical protein
MLAFDLETTGLDPEVDDVTCACAYDPDEGVDLTFFFSGGPGDTPEAFFSLLDNAPRLCAFNGARFDLPFLQTRYGIPDARVGRWALKLYDLYEACRLGFGSGFSLNAALAANGMDSKTGTGKDAVVLAREGRWDELGAYCRMDTVKTRELSRLGSILLPLRGGRAGARRLGGRFQAGSG